MLFHVLKMALDFAIIWSKRRYDKKQRPLENKQENDQTVLEQNNSLNLLDNPSLITHRV